MTTSPALPLKDTVFYTKQIQEKLAESIAVMSIGQNLPTHQFVSQVFKNDQSQDQSSDQYFQQIQYFINQPLEVLPCHQIPQIQKYLQFYFKQQVKIVNIPHQFNQQSGLYYFYEIKQKSAVVFVYKYQIQKTNNCINLYACFEHNTQLLQKKSCCLIQLIQQINTYFQFQSLKIQSLLTYDTLIVASLSINSKRFQLLFKQRQLHSQQFSQINLSNNLTIVIKQKLLQFFISTINNRQIDHKFIIIYCFNSAQDTVYFENPRINSLTLNQLNLEQKILLVYECFIYYGITLNFDMVKMQLKQSIFSKRKQKTYIKNIIYVIDSGMKDRKQLQKLGIEQQFHEIVKQHKDKQIMNQFKICYLSVKQKKRVDGSKQQVI